MTFEPAVVELLDFIGEVWLAAFVRDYMDKVTKTSMPYPLTTPLSVVPDDRILFWQHTKRGRDWFENFYNEGWRQDIDTVINEIHQEQGDMGADVDSDADTVIIE
jgi:hypothetical protein